MLQPFFVKVSFDSLRDDLEWHAFKTNFIGLEKPA